MRRSYGWNEVLVRPEDLQAFAWSAPMRDLAAKLEMSDTGLKKLLRSYGICPPPQGYWNKLQAGKPVPKAPRIPSRGPGELGRLRLDDRFTNLLPIAEPLPSSGPFASELVPEDLHELYTNELRAVGRVSVPRTLDRVHRGLAQILGQEKRRREKFESSGWDWHKPIFDTAFDKRRLRILSAVFMALSRRGHDGDAYEHEGQLHAVATVGDTRVGLEVEKVGCKTNARTVLHEPPHSATTPLIFRVKSDFDREVQREWQDDQNGKLESKIGSIAAGIIAEGEAKFRRELRAAEERSEQSRIRQEKERQEELARRNQERLNNLHKSGELLHQAEQLRALVNRVREATLAGSLNVDEAVVAAWADWALAEADRIDPICSRQVLSHLMSSVK